MQAPKFNWDIKSKEAAALEATGVIPQVMLKKCRDTAAAAEQMMADCRNTFQKAYNVNLGEVKDTAIAGMEKMADKLQPLNKLILVGQINDTAASTSKCDAMNVAVNDVMACLKDLHVCNAAMKARVKTELAVR